MSSLTQCEHSLLSQKVGSVVEEQSGLGQVSGELRDLVLRWAARRRELPVVMGQDRRTQIAAHNQRGRLDGRSWRATEKRFDSE